MNDKNSKMQYDSSTLLKLAQSPLAKGRPNNMPIEIGFTITMRVIDGALVAVKQSQDSKIVELAQKSKDR